MENDHIFPSAILKKNGYSRVNRIKYALAQELTNRALLTQLGNRRKSASPAADYLREIKEKSPGALENQCIPTDESLWEIENYEDFLAERRKLLAENLNKYLTELANEKEEEYGSASLEEILLEGESEELEFKSSMRWDYKQGVVNKVLEAVIIKTISAFANSDGGTLMIGVDDDGKAIGLENDYASLNGDKDKFELHLRNLLNKSIGAAFVASNLKTYFPVVYGNEICQIEVGASREPIAVEVKDKNGNKSEKIYVRNGNSSQALSISEFNDFRKGRFD